MQPGIVEEIGVTASQPAQGGGTTLGPKGRSGLRWAAEYVRASVSVLSGEKARAGRGERDTEL